MSYDMIDRFLRNNLDDEDYEEYLAALDDLCIQVTPQDDSEVPLYTADQLAAAVLAERERCVEVCQRLVMYGPVAEAQQRYNQAYWHCVEAIRKGDSHAE